MSTTASFAKKDGVLKTIVLQSYRTKDVPNWITTCLRTVSEWSQQSGFDHLLIGDEFFDYAPAWVRERCGTQIFPVTDLARLNLMRDYLNRGYDRAVWVDADVVVFAPHLFKIDAPTGYAFSHEVVLDEATDGRIHISAPRINNAVMVFEKNHPMLEFYRFATEAILHQAPPGELVRTMVGPQFLIALDNAMPVTRLTSVGLFTPRLMTDIAEGGPLCAAYTQKFGYEMGAANLCHCAHHFADNAGRQRIDSLFDRAIDKLLTTQGRIMNRHLRDGGQNGNMPESQTN